MERRHIETFIKVSERESFSKAASDLGYSQAAITIQIQQLERSLDTKLFDRINKKVSLTQEGKQFLAFAYDISKSFSEAENYNKSKEKGTLRIGTVDSLATSLFPEFVFKFYQNHPEIELVIELGKTDDLIEKLHHNELDFVYTLDNKIYDPSITKVLTEPEKIVFVSSDSRLKSKNNIHLNDLMSFPFLLTEKNASYRYELEKQLADLNIEVKALLEVGNTDIIINLLEKGIGISFLPRFAVSKAIEKHELFEVDVIYESVVMWGQVIHHQQKYMSQTILDFIAIIEEHYEQRKSAD